MTNLSNTVWEGPTKTHCGLLVGTVNWRVYVWTLEPTSENILHLLVLAEFLSMGAFNVWRNKNFEEMEGLFVRRSPAVNHKRVLFPSSVRIRLFVAVWKLFLSVDNQYMIEFVFWLAQRCLLEDLRVWVYLLSLFWKQMTSVFQQPVSLAVFHKHILM